MMYVYTYFNKKASFYEPPFYSPVEKEGMAESVKRAMILEPQQAKATHKDECDFYYLGSFDDKVGQFDLVEKPEFILSCDQFFVKGDQK